MCACTRPPYVWCPERTAPPSFPFLPPPPLPRRRLEKSTRRRPKKPSPIAHTCLQNRAEFVHYGPRAVRLCLLSPSCASLACSSRARRAPTAHQRRACSLSCPLCERRPHLPPPGLSFAAARRLGLLKPLAAAGGGGIIGGNLWPLAFRRRFLSTPAPSRLSSPSPSLPAPSAPRLAAAAAAPAPALRLGRVPGLELKPPLLLADGKSKRRGRLPPSHPHSWLVHIYKALHPPSHLPPQKALSGRLPNLSNPGMQKAPCLACPRPSFLPERRGGAGAGAFGTFSLLSTTHTNSFYYPSLQVCFSGSL